MTAHSVRTHSLILGAALLLGGCSDDMPDATFNAYFYYPDSREEFMGEVLGLQACRDITRARATELNMIGTHNWTYACCRKTEFSECAQQHF